MHRFFSGQAIFRLWLLLLCFSLNTVSAQIRINEIQPSNLATFLDEYQESDDWIELFNSGSSPVDLSGYAISDDSLDLRKFVFPSYSLGPQDHLLLVAADPVKTEITATWQTAVRENDTWRYRANTSAPPDTNWRNTSFNDGSWNSGTGGIGYGDGDDGTTISTTISAYSRRTFSIADTAKILDAVFHADYDDAFVAYLNGIEIARANIGVPGIRPAWNAVSASSHEAVMYQGQLPDSFHVDAATLKAALLPGNNVLAIEVHNLNSTNTDLSGRFWLSFLCNPGAGSFYSLPSWFRAPAKMYFHTGFKLSRTGETVWLSDPAGNVLDSKATGSLEADHAVARIPDGGSWCLTDQPTPDASNNASSCGSGYAGIPVFSKAAGFYASAQSLTITTTYPGGQVRYTLDGSDVTSSSPLASGPITLNDTAITVRARVFASGVLPGTTITNSYFIGVNSRLPVYSLTTDPDNLWDYNTGIYVEGPNADPNTPHWGANYWMDWEKPVTVEFFDRARQRAFRFNGGLKITGGWSRSAPQKSFEINLGDRYGLSSLDYPMESLKPWMTGWDNFILHMTGNDRSNARMRDPLMQRLLRTTFNDYVAYEPCLLFLNGGNWGVYYTRENDDHHWVKLNYGYDDDEIDLLKESYFASGIEVKRGSTDAFWKLYNYATTVSPSNPAYYDSVASMMDLQNMADYFIAETYYPNDDWMGGGNNNLKLWRPRKEGGKFRYLIYDLDFGLGLYGSVTNNMLSVARNPSPQNYNSDIFDALTQNTVFRRYFINRYADLINTIFLPSNVQQVAYMYRDTISTDMAYQFAWGSNNSDWLSNIQSMLTFASQRPSNVRGQIQSEFGLSGQVTLTLQVQPAGAGRIEISTITPTSYPWSGVYFNGNPVTITAIPNPGYSFDHWRSNTTISSNNPNRSVTYNFTSSDAITAYFNGSAAAAQVEFSEINFNSDSAWNTGDWIELRNPAAFDLDISGWKFRDDADNHTYTLPTGTVLPAGGYLVLASDLDKFASINPAVTNVIGDFGFDFNNGGEELRLFNRDDQLFGSVFYDDFAPWPVTADGAGFTLERVAGSADPNDPASWFAGCYGGSPGRAYGAPTIGLTAAGTTQLCQGATVTLTASPANATTYQWQRDGVDIPGATAVDYVASVTGVYRARVNAGGCTGLSDTLRVTVSAISSLTSTTGASRCGDGSVQLQAVSTSPIEWYDAASGGTLVGTGTSFTTPVLQTTTTYYAQAAGSCPGPLEAVTAVVNAVTADPVTQDDSRCGDGSLTLTATDTAAVRWYATASGGSVLASGYTFVTPALTSTTTYYAEAGTLCPSNRVPAVATILPLTADPVTQSDSRCGPGSVTLTATDTAQIRWYDAPVGGTLLATGSSFTTPILTATTTYYAEAGDVCPSQRIPADAIIISGAALPATQDATRCGPGTLLLTATPGDTATLYWYDAAVGGTLLSTGNTYTTPVLNTSTTYYVQAGLSCPSARIAVDAIITSNPVDPQVTGAQRCGSGTLTLAAVSSDPVSWYDAPGGNLLGTGLSFTTPSISVDITYYAQSGSGSCLSNFIPVLAQINPVSVDPVVTGGSVCGFGQVLLTASAADPMSWAATPGGAVIETGGTYLTPIIAVNTTYYVQAGTLCPSNWVAVTATVHALPSPDLGPDLLIASGDSAVLDPGAGFSGYLWSDGSTLQTLVVNSDGTYAVSVTDANGCSASDTVVVNVATAAANLTPRDLRVIAYPNPAGDHLLLLHNGLQGEVGITVYDGAGRIVLYDVPRLAAETLYRIDTGSWPSGLYRLRVEFEGKVWNLPVVIAHR